MKLEDQVTNLELSKKLKKLGVKQESVFWWEHITEMATASGVQKANYWRITDGAFRRGFVPAFTPAELGEKLPDLAYSYKKSKDDFVCEYIKYKLVEYAKTEANVRAKMLIYLIENKLL